MKIIVKSTCQGTSRVLCRRILFAAIAAAVLGPSLPIGADEAMANTSSQSTSAYGHFRAELARMGFDKYRPHAWAVYQYELEYLTEDELKEGIEDTSEINGFPFYQASCRMHMADGEDLAEGGIGELLEKLRAFLRLQGVHEFKVKDEFESDYTVMVDEASYLIYTEKEGADPRFNSWGVAEAMTLKIINDLLTKAGSPERAYLYSGGNDGQVIFLTPEMYELFQGFQGIEERDKPHQVEPNLPRYI